MISGTVNHVKFKRLARELKLSEWECVGILESIWMFTARSHICGDIGTSENVDIAIGIGWEDNEDVLINALVKCGWLDECKSKRLVVHDWNIHCPNHVKGNVAKYGKTFFKATPCEPPRELPCETPNDAPNETPQGNVPPSQAKPNQAKPSQALVVFNPPTHEQAVKHIREYSEDRSLNLSAEYCGFTAELFINHFENTGWKLSSGKGAKMKSWERALTKWVMNDYKKNIKVSR